MENEPSTVVHDLLDVRRFGTLADQFPDLSCRIHVRTVAVQRLFHRRCRRDRPSDRVIDQLGVDVAVGKMNRFNSVEFESIVFKCFEARIKALGISLSKSSYRRFSSEVIAHTHFVTDFLIELRNSFGVELFFEYDLSLLDNKYKLGIYPRGRQASGLFRMGLLNKPKVK